MASMDVPPSFLDEYLRHENRDQEEIDRITG
jgi:hypothetical protein